MMSLSKGYTGFGRRLVFDVLKLLRLRGLTRYAATHIKQAQEDDIFTIFCFSFFFIAYTVPGVAVLISCSNITYVYYVKIVEKVHSGDTTRSPST